MHARQFDLGIVVPLKEEFRYVTEAAPVLESIPYEGTYFYRLDFGSFSAICCLVDQMGPIPALQATTRLLEFADVKLVVLLGLAGALDKDVAVGDVAVAAEVNEFQANSKAESVDEGYEVHYSGRHWPLEFAIREAISHFEFSASDAYCTWQSSATNDYDNLNIDGKEIVCSSSPTLHLGPIASGTVVAASTAFVNEVKRIDRKFVAIDMEAAGVAPAASERIHPLPCLVVRGISDPANETKAELEKQGKGAWRRYCVRNATNFLRNLLLWDGFLLATGLRESQPGTTETNVITELVSHLKDSVGGPWLVGAAFGLYSHGPRVLNGGAVPMDISRLRVSDPRVNELLDAANLAKEQAFSGSVQEATKSFSNLLDRFRGQLDSTEGDSLLVQFDQVVVEMLCPDREDESLEPLILESERLEEEQGPEAVIELLRDVHNNKPQLRERYVDALAATQDWHALSQVVTSVDVTTLSRRELENGIFACSSTGATECVNQMLHHYETNYHDNAAKLFRNEVRRKFAT